MFTDDEVKVASEPEDLLRVLANPIYHFKRIGLEAWPLSQWLFSALAEAGLPVICVEVQWLEYSQPRTTAGRFGNYLAIISVTRCIATPKFTID